MKALKQAFSVIFLLIATIAAGQRPSGVPYDTEPVRFFESPANIIFYIIIPLAIIVFYIIWRRRIRKEKDKE